MATNDGACPGCGGSGWYVLRVPYAHPEFGKLHRCECQDGKPTPKQVAALAQLRKELGLLADCALASFNTDRRLDALDIDGERMSIAEQRSTLVRALAACQRYAARPEGWLYLYGSVGVGKSHLAAAVTNEVAGRGLTTSYASVPDLLDFIRDGYGNGSAHARMGALQATDLLVMDDLGAEAAKRDTEELLFKLMNARYLANRATVITSNIHPDDLEPRIADRIMQQTGAGARVVWMLASSYRRMRPR